MKKQITILLMSLLMISSCIAPDKDKTTVTELKSLARPDVDYDWEVVMKDTTGKFSVLKQVNGKGQWVAVDSTWKHQVKIPKSTFLVQMSRDMVSKIMSLSDYFSTELIVGIVLMLILFGTIIFILIRVGWTIEKFSFGTGFLFVLALGFCIRTIQKKPSELSENNIKQLSRTEYETIIKTDPNLDSFWLAKWEANELVGVTNKNKK